MAGFTREEYLETLAELKSPDELIPRIVHDLRNRVNGILGVTHLLNEDMQSPITDEQKQQVLAILRENALDILNIANAALLYHEQTSGDQ